MPGRHPLANLLSRVQSGDPLNVAEENILRYLASREIDLVNAISDSRGIRQAFPPVPSAEGELYWGMLMESHPGISVPGSLKCFSIILAVYCEDEGADRFDCSTPASEYEVAVDFHYGAPQPGSITVGWFKKRPFKWATSGFIYHVVSLGCSTNPPCSNYGLSGGECPDQSTDPCG